MTIEPEVEAAQTALAALPPDWVTPTFEATILRRAALQVAARKLAVMVVDAQTDLDATLQQITEGDVADERLTALIAHQATLLGIADAGQLLPVPAVDAGAVEQVLDVAGRALQQHAPSAPSQPDYFAEQARWRNYCHSSGRVVDAPVATDADRAAEPVWQDAEVQVSSWRSGVAAWHQTVNVGNFDPLSMLGSAQSYLDQAGELARVVATADKSTSAANSARRAAGLNWKAAA